MSTNYIKVFGGDSDANVISDATYDGLSYLGTGFSSGILYSNQLNKVLRQATLVGSSVAQLCVNTLSADYPDDGSTSTGATLIHNMIASIATASVSLSGYAPLASPTFTGTPTAPTPATSDNSTKLATTAYVQAQAYASASSVSSLSSTVSTHTSQISTLNSEVSTLAPINSPGFTGTPTAPTPSSGDNSTKLATTAFVESAIGAAAVFTGDTPASGVSSGSWMVTTYGTVAGSRTVVGIGQGTCTNGQTVGIGGSTSYSPSQFIIAACVGTLDTSPIGTGSGWNGIVTTCSVSGQTVSVDAHEQSNPSNHYSATAFWSGFFIQYNF